MVTFSIHDTWVESGREKIIKLNVIISQCVDLRIYNVEKIEEEMSAWQSIIGSSPPPLFL